MDNVHKWFFLFICSSHSKNTWRESLQMVDSYDFFLSSWGLPQYSREVLIPHPDLILLWLLSEYLKRKRFLNIAFNKTQQCNNYTLGSSKLWCLKALKLLALLEVPSWLKSKPFLLRRSPCLLAEFFINLNPPKSLCLLWQSHLWLTVNPDLQPQITPAGLSSF